MEQITKHEVDKLICKLYLFTKLNKFLAKLDNLLIQLQSSSKVYNNDFIVIYNNNIYSLDGK